MSCWLAFGAVCLLNSEGVYVTAELQTVRHYETPTHNEGHWCGGHWCRGPLATVRVGMEWNLPGNWTLDTAAYHASFPMENDTGMNAVVISLTWRPFQ